MPDNKPAPTPGMQITPRGQSFRDFLEGEFAADPELRREIEKEFESTRLDVEALHAATPPPITSDREQPR